MDSVVWNDLVKLKMENDIATQQKIVNDNTPVILDLTRSAVLNLPGASTQITAAKQKIESAINAIKATSNTLANYIDTIASDQATTRTAIDYQKQSVNDLQEKVSQGNTLAMIRAEQAESLRRKYDSNFHTSFLGLNRPLSDQSQTGLIVVSVVFGVIACITIVFAVRNASAMKSIIPELKLPTRANMPALLSRNGFHLSA